MTHQIIRRALRPVVLAAALLAAGQALLPGQAADPGLVLRGATIYATPEGPAIPDGVVVIRAGKIAAVGASSEVPAPPNMPVVDLAGRTVLAGFWNSHVHFEGKVWEGADASPPTRIAEAVRDMLTQWGFTTVFDTGSALANTLALRRRIEAGEIDGPTIFATGDIMFPRGVTRGRIEVGTPAEAAAASARLLDGGADALKVYAQTFWDLNLKLSPDVLAAVVAQAHGRKSQVFAHPSNRDGLHNAVDAGVDMLVHTTPQIGPWGDALVAKMKASNIALVPTLKLWRFELARDKVPEPALQAFQDRGVAQLREYFSAGGPILFGTDVGYMTDFSTLEEFQRMADAGMGFRDILASLTTTPARRRGVGERVGRVAVGFDADLTVLQADPARSVSAFAEVAYTIRRGRIIYRATPK